jgi:hypothetical protein
MGERDVSRELLSVGPRGTCLWAVRIRMGEEPTYSEAEKGQEGDGM